MSALSHTTKIHGSTYIQSESASVANRMEPKGHTYLCYNNYVKKASFTPSVQVAGEGKTSISDDSTHVRSQRRHASVKCTFN